MRRLKRFVRGEEGFQLVEFALSATVYFTMLFGIIDFCMATYAGSFVAFAAQQGTRYAMVRGADWTSSCATTSSYNCAATQANVQNYILSLPHPALNIAASDITVTWPGNTAAGASAACATTPNGQGCQVKVKIIYSFNMKLPFYSPSFSLTGTSVETIQN